MNAAILTQFYPPEACAAATRVRSLAQALVQSGHDVTVITNFPSFPSGTLAPADRKRVISTEHIEGVRVVRTFTRTFARTPLARLWQWLLAAWAASAALVFTKRRFDVVIVSVPPVTLALPALLACKRHGAKLVVDVRDVYPDIAIAMGEWSEQSLFARGTGIAARALYRNASLVGAVTPTALRQIAARGVEPQRLLLVPNGCEDDVPLRAEPPERELFTALYAGNLGLATDVDVLVDAATALRNDAVRIEIAGDGAEGSRMRRRVREEGLHNVTFAGSVPRDKAMELLASAGVALIPLRAGIRESVPTKLWDALSAGCPAIVAAEGEARAAALESGGVFCVPAGDARALAQAIKTIASLPAQKRREMGMRGRAFVVTRYRRSAVMGLFAARIGAALRSNAAIESTSQAYL